MATDVDDILKMETGKKQETIATLFEMQAWFEIIKAKVKLTGSRVRVYRRPCLTFYGDLNFSTRNFPYLVKLNDNGSYHGLREPIRKLENHYPKLKITNR